MPTADSLSRMRLGAAPMRPRSSLFYRQGANTGPARTASTSTTAISSGGGGEPVSGGGYDDGSYGGGGGAVAAAPAPRISLRDFIDQDFGYRQAQEEYGDNGRRIQEFDAETERGRGETERDVTMRKQMLDTDLGEESIGAAEDLAGRGMLRSGGLFLEQDRINKEGNQRRSAIDDILADFISQRGSGRVQQQQANRSALNDRINQLTQQYQSQYGV